MRKEVFISYKSEEYSDALWVKESLEKEGISCWMAPMDIAGGSSYASEIPTAIKNCKVFVLILSKAAQESKWVPRELDQAINENKIIMPFTVKKCALKSDFSFYLTNVQRYDAYLNKNGALEAMTKDIKKALGIKETVYTATQATAQSTAQTTRVVKQKAPIFKKEKKAAKPVSADKKLLAKKIGLGVLAVILVIGIGVLANTVWIGGERFSKSDRYIELTDKTLDAKDLESISKMKKRSTIHFHNCVFTESDISALVGENTWYLALEDCELTTEQVASLDLSNSRIEVCDLSGNKNVTSLDFLAPVVSALEKLDVSNTSVTELSILASAENLVELRADGNGISDISALSNCIKLEILSLCGNELTSLSGLENATILCSVNLSDNQLQDVSILGKSAATMKNLYLINNQIKDISFLESFTEMEYLRLDNNQITSLSSLENMTKLVGISAAGNQLTNTKGIEGKSSLKYVDLSDNKIEKIGTEDVLLFTSSAGGVLDVSNNPLESVNISYDGTFAFLSFAGCDIENYTFLNDIDGYEMILPYNDAIDWQMLYKKSYNDIYIISCPADQKMNLINALGESVANFVEEGDTVPQIEDYYYEDMKTDMY